jgi:hypothetical protein
MKLLSRSGELLNVVNCFAGRITVLRAASDNELGPYQRGLAGVGGPEHIVINVDGKPYQPEEHVVIGFGHSLLENDCSVQEYLHASGVPAGAIAGMLVSYGLERKTAAVGSQLTADETRRLELLAAANTIGKVIVMNAPFEPLASTWRERFAELLSSFAVRKQQIIVIPKLVYRPESWIDNEAIARVQVGQNMQRTIGFGSGPSSVNDIIKEVRHLLKDDDAANAFIEKIAKSRGAETGRPVQFKQAPGPSDHREKAENNRNVPRSSSAAHARFSKSGTGVQDDMLRSPVRPNRALAAFGGLLGIFNGAARLMLKQFGSLSPTLRMAALGTVALLIIYLAIQPGRTSIQQTLTARASGPAPAVQQSPAQVETIPPTEKDLLAEIEPAQTGLPPVANSQSAFVLDHYPTPVKQSVVAAFNGEVSQSSDVPKVRYPLVVQKDAPQASQAATEKKTNLFALLEAASNTGEEGPPNQVGYPRPPGPATDFYRPDQAGDPDAQRKREIIHQKFLEAIRKASERRQMNTGF